MKTRWGQATSHWRQRGRRLRTVLAIPRAAAICCATRLAALHGVAPDAITPGNGSNDVLDMIARVFLGPGVEAVYSQHAFAVYPIAVQAVGATARVAPAHDGSRGPAYGHDLAAMRSLVGPATRVVFIANPNNPTGTWLGAGELREFVAGLPDHVMVVIDEAYFEYVSEANYPDTSRWLADCPNLIVTRTFSKAYGLAGLRAGYAVSSPEVAQLLNRVRQPFNVNSIAQAAALAALDDVAHLESSIRLNRVGMQQLVSGFTSLGLSFIESAGNFVAVDIGGTAAECYERLLRQGVIVRPIANYGMPKHLRVTHRPARRKRTLSRSTGKGAGVINRLCIIGVGLIGGSLARALRAAGYCREVIGAGRNPDHLHQAVELGVIDRFETDPGLAVEGADMVLVAVPLGAMESVFRSIHGRLAEGAVLTDAGSAKGSVIEAAGRAFGRVPDYFVPGHPIAGTENSGVAASLPTCTGTGA